MGLIDHRFEDNFITTNIDKILTWARYSALWPMQFGLARPVARVLATTGAASVSP